MTFHPHLARVALGASLGAATLLAAGSPALASKDYSGDCTRRLVEVAGRIDGDLAVSGENSRDVARDRYRMEAARNWCREHNADWDRAHFDAAKYVGNNRYAAPVSGTGKQQPSKPAGGTS